MCFEHLEQHLANNKGSKNGAGRSGSFEEEHTLLGRIFQLNNSGSHQNLLSHSMPEEAALRKVGHSICGMT